MVENKISEKIRLLAILVRRKTRSLEGELLEAMGCSGVTCKRESAKVGAVEATTMIGVRTTNKKSMPIATRFLRTNGRGGRRKITSKHNSRKSKRREHK